MQVVIRQYSGEGAAELFDLLEANAAGVQSLMESVNGLVSYTLARTENGGFSVTVCQDKTGIDESLQKARDWIAKNAGKTAIVAPEVSLGSVIVHVK
jgi:hypothetical protein